MENSDNYYNVLHCGPSSSLEELKRNYKSLVLQYHPDKCDGIESEAYMLLNKAWKTLCDPALRKEYDENLNRLANVSSHVIYATLSVDEMDYDSNLECFSHGCRCGGTYSVCESELRIGDNVIPCEDCSMAIVIRKIVSSNCQKEAVSQ